MAAFTLREPYQAGLLKVKRTLNEHGLRTPLELDVALRIKDELGAELAPCTVLLVDDPSLLLEGLLYGRGAAMEIPLPVVVSGHGRYTEVLIRRGAAQAPGRDGWAQNPVCRLQSRVAEAIGAIAERERTDSLIRC